MAVTVVKHKDGTYSVKGISFEELKGLSVLSGCSNANPFDTYNVFNKMDDAVAAVEPKYGEPFRSITIDLANLAKGE